MSKLTVFRETGEKLLHTEDAGEIANILGAVGVIFTRWQAEHAVNKDMTAEQVMQCYQKDINYFVEKSGYQKVDVINMHPEHPHKQALREKFLSEHKHMEDEIRFFVNGEGLFTLHIKDKVYAVLCCQNDLISVPAGTPHWFDMGNAPQFTAIRFFNNPEGWVAHYTGSEIAKQFPSYHDAEAAVGEQVEQKVACKM